MDVSPLWVFWILLIGAAVVTAVTYFQPRFVGRAAAAVMTLAWLAWWLLGRRLPILAVTTDPSSVFFSWQMDKMSWQLSGVWLLLVTAVQTSGGGRRAASEESLIGLRCPPLAALLLAATGLAPLLAGNLAALLAAALLLIGAWSAVLWLCVADIHDNPAQMRPQVVWLMLSLLFIWLGATMAPESGVSSLDMRGWPTAATSSVLTAAWLLLGAWPFHGWRPTEWDLPPELAALIHTAPALAGLTLLARLVQSSDVSLGYSLFLTAFGLLGLLVGVRRAWANFSPAAAAAGLALAQVSLAALTIVWVGADVVVTEARVLALAAGLVFGVRGRRLKAADGAGKKPVWETYLFWIGPAAALGAMAGGPFLAGFAGRTGLYRVWVENGRFVLLLVAVLLHMLLVTAVLWRFGDSPEFEDETGDPRFQLAAGLLLTAGLLSFSGLGGAPLLIWLAVLVSLAGGGLLFYYGGEAVVYREALRRAFTVELPLDTPRQWLRDGGGWLETAVRDAAAILEGDGGLLWLLALLIAFLLAGG